jgi:hypothetical protein
MAMQTSRFLLVLLAGPPLTRLVARRLPKDAGEPVQGEMPRAKGLK